MDRRSLLNTSATMAVGAVAGCALPGVAQQRQKTPFEVPATNIPIVGSDMMFPVRRIYCIGRNYAAHAREMGSRPHARATVLLPETHRRDPERGRRRRRRPPLSAVDEELPL